MATSGAVTARAAPEEMSVGTVLSVFGVAPRRIGGFESYARELSRQLGERGWRSVLAFEEPPTDAVRDYLELPNVTLAVLPRPERTSLDSVRGMARLLRRHRPDVLHLHATGFVGAYPWLARVHGTRRVLFTDQTSRPEGHVIERPPAWKRLLTRGIDWPLDHVVCVSEYGRRCLRGLDVLPAERFVLVYNSVDLARPRGSREAAAALRDRFRIPGRHRLVTQVSWLIPEKGIQDLLHAAKRVLVERRDAHFMFVGDGRDAERFQALASGLRIAQHVTWAGLIHDPMAEGVFTASDVCCQVSRWEEVFGWVIAEAMVSERPVIGTRVGGIPELIDDGRTGLLVDRGDHAAIADGILGLLADPDRRLRMGRAARDAAEARFSLSANVARVVEFYSDGGPRNGPPNPPGARSAPAEPGRPR